MKIFFGKIKKYKLNKGMTYVELIVVLSIFSVFSGMAIFNYKGFQSRVDIKNLANEMALQIVEAQKSALNGKLPPSSQQSLDSEWKPSYGIYFNLSPGTNTGNKVFYYFVDSQPKDSQYDELFSCPASECINKINITKGNYITEIESFNGSYSPVTGPLSITFTRPNSGAVFYYSNQENTPEHVRITLASPDGSVSTYIKIFPSGRVELSDNDE